MAIEIVSREIIKPSSPTPHHLKHLKLSFFDQVAPDIYPKLVLFYAPDIPLTPNSQKSLILRSSLSQTLTRFYPFAGRIQDDRSINCDDSGADYVEARFSGDLSKVLEVPYAEMLQQFMPAVPETAAKGKLLAVQVTFFDDGGLAIGFSSSHKISDGPTASMFLTGWVACARKDELFSPEFVLGTVFPMKDCPVMIPTDRGVVGCKGLVSKRFVFSASKLVQLKKLTGGTRVESVMALIWKVGITESRNAGRGCSRWSSVLNGTVDLRQRSQPPLGDSVAGNCTGLFIAKHTVSEVAPELHHLVNEMRRALEEHVVKGAKDGWVVEMERLWGSVKIMKEMHDVESYGFASWSRMPVYDMDFGWGRPVLACPATFPHENMTVLMSTSDDEGLEAWIMLEPDRMNRFQHNEEMLAFASVDPPVFNELAGEGRRKQDKISNWK